MRRHLQQREEPACVRLGCEKSPAASLQYVGVRRLALARGETRASHRLPGALTSAAMLGFKLAHVEVLQWKLDEQKLLKEERAELIAKLGAACSPELALQVEAIVDLTRRSFLMPEEAVSLPKPACVDGAEADARRGFVREVRERSPRALSP
jgi:hypothetical protein